MSVTLATKRQLWALYCITKHDYRNENLTYEEAYALIKKLGKSDYNKATKKTNMKDEFMKYYKEHILPKVVVEIKSAMNIVSVVAEDTNYMKGTGPDGTAKQYIFRGSGCSISYLDYDKRSKRAAELEQVFRSVRFNECKKLVEKSFSKKLLNQMEKEGCPIGAIYCQDYNVNSTLYHGVVSFAKNILKINSHFDYITRLD